MGPELQRKSAQPPSLAQGQGCPPPFQVTPASHTAYREGWNQRWDLHGTLCHLGPPRQESGPLLFLPRGYSLGTGTSDTKSNLPSPWGPGDANRLSFPLTHQVLLSIGLVNLLFCVGFFFFFFFWNYLSFKQILSPTPSFIPDFTEAQSPIE